VVFTPEDGNSEKWLTISSYPGEHATIKGSVPLTPQWQPYRDGILKAKIESQIPIDMLIVDGKIRHMARYPNFDSTAVRFNGTSADATSPERVKSWKDPAGGYLHAMHKSDWGDFHYRISGKDEEGNLELEGGWQNNRRYGLSQENRMVENIFEELDAPGEWYYDRSEAMLYYHPLPNEAVDNAKFEVAQLKQLVEFRGTEQQPVKNITIKDIEFTQTARTFMEEYEPLLRSDWTVYRGAAIFFDGTENCFIKSCYLHNLGGNAVFFSNYNQKSGISGSHLTRIGASAVCFVGDPQAVRSPSFEYSEFVPFAEIDRVPGPQTNNYPADCLVYDNLIHTIGLFEKQVTGVELSMCRSITVSHNSIYDVPRAGINISEGTWGGHLIEYNDVFDTVKETGDHGAFNSWGRDRYWHPKRDEMDDIAASEPSLILADAGATVEISNNRFRCDRGWDIDLDDGSSNFHIYNNLCLNGGIKLREGFYRVVENNIMVNNTFHPHVWFENSGDVFARNIVMSPYQPIRVPYWGTMVDYNIFTDRQALEDARGNKMDEHSIVYPVNFRDPAHGDYRVDSKADAVFRLGFHNFEMDRFGVVSPHLRSLAKTPRMTLPFVSTEPTASNVVEWQGWRIKDLETLGERSATGMDSERGVYVLTIVSFDSSMRDFLRANDVILKFDGKAVNKLEDLKKAIEQADLTESLEMVIFRDQKEVVIMIPGNRIQPEN
ncbi:MAG: right-handed parallel beta-helix repeat-containing protein, partial [Lewinella sp.]|nr:right-handed parallel beta-helix repeat-containing protein [Lewinella sp.]